MRRDGEVREVMVVREGPGGVPELLGTCRIPLWQHMRAVAVQEQRPYLLGFGALPLLSGEPAPRIYTLPIRHLRSGRRVKPVLLIEGDPKIAEWLPGWFAMPGGRRLPEDGFPRLDD